jgi:MFS family permease
MLALWASAAPTLVYPLYISAWHLTTAETTMIFATYPTAMILALLFLGNVSDIIGGRRSMLIGLSLLTLGCLALLLAPNLGVLLAGRALMGLGIGASLGPATVAAGSATKSKGARSGTVVTIATAAGLVIALVLGGEAVETWSHPLRSGFVVLLLAILAISVLVWLTPHDRPSDPSRWRFQPLTVPRPRARFLSGALAMAAAYSLGAIYLGVGAQYARDAVGSDNALITGLILATSAVAIGIAAVAAGRARPLTALLLGAVALTFGQTLMIWSGDAREIWLLIAASAIGGAGYGLLFSAGISIVIDVAPAHHRAAATSTAYLVAYFIQATVAIGVGAISTTHGLPTGLIVGSGTVLVLVIASILLFGSVLRRPSEHIVREPSAEGSAARGSSRS